MRLRLLLSLTALSLSGCVTGNVVLPNSTACSLAGVWDAGAFCAETITGIQSQMTLDEYLDFLSPQDERPDPMDPTKTLPARAGAVCQSTFDWGRQKTALEQACRILGKRCPYELHQTIKTMRTLQSAQNL